MNLAQNIVLLCDWPLGIPSVLELKEAEKTQKQGGLLLSHPLSCSQPWEQLPSSSPLKWPIKPRKVTLTFALRSEELSVTGVLSRTWKKGHTGLQEGSKQDLLSFPVSINVFPSVLQPHDYPSAHTVSPPPNPGMGPRAWHVFHC